MPQRRNVKQNRFDRKRIILLIVIQLSETMQMYPDAILILITVSGSSQYLMGTQPNTYEEILTVT